MTRITKCFKVDPALWKKLKIFCVRKDMSYSDFLEKTINEGLKKK